MAMYTADRLMYRLNIYRRYMICYTPPMEKEVMTETQDLIVRLQKKGRTKAAIADELNIGWLTVRKWEKGRSPSMEGVVNFALNTLLERPKKEVPSRRREVDPDISNST